MSALLQLQADLAETGRYHGAIDGRFGPQTRAAIMTAMEDGPDTALTLADYRAAASRLAVPVENIMALAEVEAAGAGFEAGLPKLLFEPHRFHKATSGRYAASHPGISYAKWGSRPYPRRIAERYAQLMAAVALDVEAGFASASYGKFQILGENALACGFESAHTFAFGQARDEAAQLAAFERFIIKAGVLPYLRVGMWAEVARRYNGSAYAKNRYDVKLAQVARRISRELGA